MSAESASIELLLVDDETEFRAATRPVLERRGFRVREAGTGEECLAEVARARPDVVLLDLRMPGMDGIETLRRLRDVEPDLPVIILTGHGAYSDAMAGIRLDIVEFLQKPIDVGELGEQVRRLLTAKGAAPLREATVRDLMRSPDGYVRLYDDQELREALVSLVGGSDRIRSVLLFSRDGRFLTLVRQHDLLRLILPDYLRDSPYSTFFTGMFLAQSRVVGRRKLGDVLDSEPSVAPDAPLMEAVHLMVRSGRENIAVVQDGRLLGVLRAREVLLAVAV